MTKGFKAGACRQHLANGGPAFGFMPRVVKGPGTATSDSIQTSVPAGTYVMPADSTQKLGFGARIPVALSNGETTIPPEQVMGLGVRALNAMRDATHAPVKGPQIGFANGGYVDPDLLNKPFQQTNLSPASAGGVNVGQAATKIPAGGSGFASPSGAAPGGAPGVSWGANAARGATEAAEVAATKPGFISKVTGAVTGAVKPVWGAAKLGGKALPLITAGAAAINANDPEATNIYAKQFDVQEPKYDNSAGDIARYVALRAGGFASDVGAGNVVNSVIPQGVKEFVGKTVNNAANLVGLGADVSSSNYDKVYGDGGASLGFAPHSSQPAQATAVAAPAQPAAQAPANVAQKQDTLSNTLLQQGVDPTKQVVPAFNNGTTARDQTLPEVGNAGLNAFRTNDKVLNQFNDLNVARGNGITASRDANGRMSFTNLGAPVVGQSASGQAATTQTPQTGSGIDFGGRDKLLAESAQVQYDPSRTPHAEGVRATIGNPADDTNATFNRWNIERLAKNGDTKAAAILAGAQNADAQNAIAQQNADTAAQRATQDAAIQQGNLGVARQNAATQATAAGFQSAAMRRQEALAQRYEAAKTPEERAAIAKQIRDLSGKSDSKWKGLALQGGTDAAGNKTESVLAAVNEDTGEMRRMGGGVGSAPLQNHIDALRRDPSLAAKFDEKYGKGAAAQYLGAK